jgi:hypothetical protein
MNDEIELMTARETAALLRVSIPALYAAVAKARLQRPSYPSERTPRWLKSEVMSALERLKALPAESVAAERNARVRRARAARTADAYLPPAA